MDPLSITTGIITFLQTCSTVIKYINDATGATKERKRVREALRGCEGILQELKDEADDSEEGKAWWATIKALEGPDAPIGRLLQILRELEAELRPGDTRMNRVISSLKWPFKESDITKLLQAIDSEKSLLQLALTNKTRDLVQKIQQTANDNKRQLALVLDAIKTNTKETKAQFDALNQSLSHIQLAQGDFQDQAEEARRQKKRQEILDWLSHINYGAQHSDFIKRREKGTGTWLLESSEFVEWVEGRKQGQQHQTLFCPGIPGAGKTILTAITVDYLNERFRNDQTVGIAYAYCNFRRQEEQKADHLLASILDQLVSSQSTMPHSVEFLFAHHERKKTRPSVDELYQALADTAELFANIFIVIDALDECNQYSGCCSTLVSKIFDLQARCGAKFFATSRFITDITERFKQSTTLEIQATDDDVRRYVQGQIERLPRFVQKNPDLQEQVKTALVSAVKGMFLLAQLHVNSLVGAKSPKTLRAALTALPAGSDAYDCAYKDAMERIEGQTTSQASLAKQALMWIACAKCALSTLELQHALAVEVTDFQSEQPIEFDHDNISDIEDIVSVCAGLVTVDEKSDTIRLVHYTTQQYFERTRSKWFPNAEADIATTCITYLSFGDTECLSWKEYIVGCRSYPLLAYSILHWAHHAREVPTMCDMVVEFLRHQAAVIITMMKFFPTYFHFPRYGWDEPGDDAVRVAVLLNLEDVLTSLFCDEGDDETVKSCGALLRHAARAGYLGIVSFLLRKGSNMHAMNAEGETALWLATRHGHEAVAQLLIENGARAGDLKKVSMPAWRGGVWATEPKTMPLISFAAWRRRAHIVKLLLEKGTNPNVRDGEMYGETPLMCAARGGDESIVQLLLDYGADVDLTNHDGETAFLIAVAQSNIDASVLLLNNGSPVNSADNCYRTALQISCHFGVLELAELFVERGADVSAADWKGTTPLHSAAYCGLEAIARLLLDNGADVNSMDYRHKTPLYEAVYNAEYTVAELLLDREAHASAVQRNSSDISLLAVAIFNIAIAQRGTPYLGVDKAENMLRLLVDKGVDVDVQDEVGQTALMSAAASGSTNATKLLLELGASINLMNKQGRTPLCAAVELWDEEASVEGRKAVTKLLLDNGADVDFANERGETLLWLAARRGDEDAVAILSELGADVNRTDKNDISPLQVAIENSHDYIARGLLSNGASVNFTSGDDMRRLQIAIEYGKGKESASQFSTEDGDEDGDREDGDEEDRGKHDFDALARYTGSGFDDVGSSYTHHGISDDINWEDIDSEGVEDLKERGERGWHSEYAQTASSDAEAALAEVNIVRMVLERGADMILTGLNGVMPLQPAIIKGERKVVTLLESCTLS